MGQISSHDSAAVCEHHSCVISASDDDATTADGDGPRPTDDDGSPGLSLNATWISVINVLGLSSTGGKPNAELNAISTATAVAVTYATTTWRVWTALLNGVIGWSLIPCVLMNVKVLEVTS